MKREPVQSSSIRSVGYDRESRILEVEFAARGVYRYLDVPEFLFLGFMRASSKGTYFNKNIAPEYGSVEVK
jgi:hypothetical protein